MLTEKERKFDFIGWVPCISGSLNFEYTACGKGEGYSNINHIELARQEQVKKRFIVVSSKVDWEDFESISDGQWNVVLMASGELEADCILGKVFLIPAQSDAWLDVANLIKEIAKEVFEKQDIQQSFSRLQTALVRETRQENFFAANFKQNKSGLVYLGYADRDVKDGDLTTPMLTCRQSYYYIKYTFHKHKHHDSAESLTTIHKLSSEPDVVGKTLIGEIKKGLVRLKRDSSPADYKTLFASKGILSYTKSLAYSCKLEGLLSDTAYQAEKTYIDNLGESLEITGKRIEAGITARSAYNANFRSIGLFIFAVIAPFSLLFKEKIVNEIDHISPRLPSNHIVHFISWVASNENHIWVLIGVVLLIYFSLKNIVLRYGSPTLAAEKYHAIAVKAFEFVTDNERSSRVILGLLYFVFIAVIVALLYRLFW